MKILAVIGTRPEAIKMLPLVIELRSRRKMDVKIAFSGQHKTLANDVFDFFDITPDFVLDAMRDGQELSALTCKLLDYFDMLFAREMPDIVLVHGDTATAFCASLAAFYRGIRIAHVEAGLRTFKLRSPFPEEFYRIAIDAMSDIHFAPTSTSARNLEKEGRNTVFTVGNTVIDALKYTVRDDYLLPLSECEGQRKTVLLTMHRRENLGKKMLSSLQGIRRILLSRNDLFCILPMHPNPLVGESVQKAFKDIKNIKICPPLSMYDFHNILAKSFAVFTDSGGILEEASYLGVPSFILRDTTERHEAIEGGNAMPLGTNEEEIAKKFLSVIERDPTLKKMKNPSQAFGDGSASTKIADILSKEME